MRVLAIDVDEHLLEKWRRWFTPRHQPFRVDRLDEETLDQLPGPQPERRVSAEHRDTFFMYGGTWVWLTELQLEALPTSVRRALTVERQRVSRPKPSPCWSSQLERDGDGFLVRWVEAGVRSSQHNAVAQSTWKNAASVLPGARALAGTFPAKSGPNCFGTVMAAAGVTNAATTWMLQAPFAKWLATHTTPVSGPSNDAEPGVALVWHEHGELAHAVLTIGDGWVLNKPSQSWSSPTMVWTVREAIDNWRLPGTRLSRHRLNL